MSEASKELAEAFERHVHSQGFVRLGAEKKRLLEQFADWMKATGDPHDEIERLQRLIARVVEWQPPFPVEASLLDELAAAAQGVSAPLNIPE